MMIMLEKIVFELSCRIHSTFVGFLRQLGTLTLSCTFLVWFPSVPGKRHYKSRVFLCGGVKQCLVYLMFCVLINSFSKSSKINFGSLFHCLCREVDAVCVCYLNILM